MIDNGRRLPMWADASRTVYTHYWHYWRHAIVGGERIPVAWSLCDMRRARYLLSPREHQPNFCRLCLYRYMYGWTSCKHGPPGRRIRRRRLTQ